MTLIVCTMPLTVGRLVMGTGFAAAYAFTEPESGRITRCFDAAFTAFVKFASNVAVVPSSTAAWPVCATMNCAITAAMMLDCRHTLLSCMDCAVPERNPVVSAPNAA
ncbi:hypothetical protein WK33_27220 [Burkholderia multivorans]|nr:hypothetical protein WK33_27220 [Burkholderia multivorans]